MLKKIILALFCYTSLHFKGNEAIWPPPFQVHHKYEEEFVISDLLQPSDVDDVYDEEEMIHMNDDILLQFKNYSDRYFNIHQMAKNANERVKKDIELKKEGNSTLNGTNLPVPFNETNFDAEDDEIPHEAGFVDNNKQFIKNSSEILDSDDVVIATNGKKEENIGNYDYKDLKAQYEKELKSAEKANDTLVYKNVKEDESAKEAVETLVDFKPHKNCTKDVMNGIGLDAARCIWQEIQKPRLKKDKVNILEKALRILILWLIIYAIIAVPLWCQYGWCCCCCRCKWCQPMEIIDDAKSFYVSNPPGVYYDPEKGETITYKAGNYEKYAQKNLGAAINSL